MGNPAKKLEHGEALQETGTVVGSVGARFTVRTDAGEQEATRAVSCLVAPAAGDLVLLAVVPRGNVYILAVLEREEGSGAAVVLDGDLSIQLRSGRFRVAAQDGVDLVSGKDVSVVSRGVNVSAADGNVMLKKLSFLGTFVQAEVEKIKVFAGSFDSVLDRLSQKVKRSYRTVEEFDQLRARRVDYVATKNMSLRGGNTMITAEELVKVDGEQIHLG